MKRPPYPSHSCTVACAKGPDPSPHTAWLQEEPYTSTLPTGPCSQPMVNSAIMCRSSPLQKDLIQVGACTGSSWRFHGPLFQLGQRAPLFVFMRTELEEQKVFPMKAHLHHVKEHTGTMALNFGTDDYLFFMQEMEEQPESIHRTLVG